MRQSAPKHPIFFGFERSEKAHIGQYFFAEQRTVNRYGQPALPLEQKRLQIKLRADVDGFFVTRIFRQFVIGHQVVAQGNIAPHGLHLLYLSIQLAWH